ncbi:hypothetical protein BD770DRAFT_423065 [Pilaira anomala]|nr:hypothetical protein BD770DRAFT_423065 [Pilaira anomala]
MTDGIAVSVIKQNEDTNKGNSSKSTLSKTVDENIDYLEKLSLQEHVSTLGKCVLIDPGRRDLLYYKKLVYRYTRNQKAVETKATKFRKLRQKYKPEHVKEAEEKVSLHAASTVDINKYKNYIRARAEVSQDLYQYYSNEDKKKEERPENTLPFRKLKLSSYINQVQADKRLASNLYSVLVFGDWSGAHTKFHEPIREGFQVYLLNEYKTSSVCPTCTSSLLETFKKCKNPRPYQRSKNPIVNCHGLLRCTNQKCLESVSNNNGNNFRVWNRDLAAVLNFATIVKQLRKTMTRPDVFKRKNFEDSSAKKKDSFTVIFLPS